MSFGVVSTLVRRSDETPSPSRVICVKGCLSAVGIGRLLKSTKVTPEVVMTAKVFTPFATTRESYTSAIVTGIWMR